MKRISILPMAVLIAGCTHDVRITDVQNGITRSETEAHIGVFDSESKTVGNDQTMSNCQAKLGGMDGEEKALCLERARREAARHDRQLDWYGYPYGYATLTPVFYPTR
ncbi:hypothetical protein HY479_03200 [Candidatus Uhrbacteria bacterium]|nr:hypothetical protein [Candidatus Uhrbacteria bacterium]